MRGYDVPLEPMAIGIRAEDLREVYTSPPPTAAAGRGFVLRLGPRRGPKPMLASAPAELVAVFQKLPGVTEVRAAGYGALDLKEWIFSALVVFDVLFLSFGLRQFRRNAVL
ncbi:MAG TPA: hypothetical protein VGK70_07555 [Thermoanaerobaculia bacterium]|jgi:hypothetical protein